MYEYFDSEHMISVSPRNIYELVEIEVLTAVIMKISLFRDIRQ
jgi:hypothetical protein